MCSSDLMHLMTQAKNNVSALELKRHLDVSYPTAWLVKHKLMQVMFQREEGRQLTGRIEADDAYLGGEHPGGKPGRGSQNKIAFVAAVQTTQSGQAIFLCLSRRPFTVHPGLRREVAGRAGHSRHRRPGMLHGSTRSRHLARAARHRRRCRQRQAPIVPGRQHSLG